jgi:hypothetical protein
MSLWVDWKGAERAGLTAGSNNQLSAIGKCSSLIDANE